MQQLQQTKTPNYPTDKSQLFWKIFATIALVCFIIVGTLFYFSQSENFRITNPGTPGSYQAVFLTNGQVYFGRLSLQPGGYVVLTSIFYLQLTKDLQGQDSDQTQNENSNVTVVKLGNELHGPLDEMRINKDQILFYETLKSDSKVLQAINNYIK